MTHFSRLICLLLFCPLASALDQPEYTVLATFGEMEVREYPAFVTASVEIEGNARDAGNRGFRVLAGYIFGGNRDEEKIAMTAPVFQHPVDENAHRVSFYLAGDGHPAPDDAQVQIEPQAMTVAVVRYRGGWGQRKYEQHLALLLDALAAQSRWEVTGEPIWARYDPPFKPPFMRRNEIMIPVRAVR